MNPLLASAAAAAPSSDLPDPAADVHGMLVPFIDWIQERFFPSAIDPFWAHLIAFFAIILLTFLLRRMITDVVFFQLKRLAAKPNSKLDKRIFPALEGPAASLVMVLGIIGAISVFTLSAKLSTTVDHASRAALTTIILWGFFCAGGATLDHLEDVGRAKQLRIAVFMPLIKKTLAALFGVFALLVIAESLGWEVKEFLAGLGIGGLAIALAAQDALANLFGSFVVMMDDPFHLGDVVRIGANEGSVEDIGLRSTRLRTGARTQIIIPNKTVAGEAITNYTRMPQRRVDQKIGLTYDTTPLQMKVILEEIRNLISAEAGVHKGTINVTFTDFSESSLDIQILYFSDDPDWGTHMALRERINLAIMDVVGRHKLSFAFPTQTVVFDGPVAKQLAGPKGP